MQAGFEDFWSGSFCGFGNCSGAWRGVSEVRGICEEVQQQIPFDFAQGRLSTSLRAGFRLTTPNLHPKEHRPLFGDPGTERRLGRGSLRMTRHLLIGALGTG